MFIEPCHSLLPVIQHSKMISLQALIMACAFAVCTLICHIAKNNNIEGMISAAFPLVCQSCVIACVTMQAMTKLKEPKIVLKVRKADLSLLKEILESIKSKFKKVGIIYIHAASMLRRRLSQSVALSSGAICCTSVQIDNDHCYFDALLSTLLTRQRCYKQEAEYVSPLALILCLVSISFSYRQQKAYLWVVCLKGRDV